MPDLTSPNTEILAVDSHVHLYDMVNFVPMLDAALTSFTRAVKEKKAGQPFCGVLVLTEPRQRDTFAQLRRQVEQEHLSVCNEDWSLQQTKEQLSLTAVHRCGGVIFLISGQQVVTCEGLEVLSIATEQSLPDQMSLKETVHGVRERDGFPVLPWGVGKWLFGRGKIIDSIITENNGKPLAVGDNGGRPSFWTMVGQFDRARLHDLPILNGTDPLPAKNTTRSAGSYGTIICCPLDRERPAYSLLAALGDSATERIGYGDLETPTGFLRDQITLRLC